MRAGDLVKWHRVNNDDQDDIITESGLVISIEPTDVLSCGEPNPPRVLVLFEGGDLEWMSKTSLEVIHESR